ncbi:phage holin family protein [Aurantibacillus circumpalustris]|uniref:phage holin family protein n=1 Tax=Aurantibacillus circumpalustris TaxID=3036359 RepID=UPI00295BF46B|nr:phage holin family protein [Aurantibacillus circumpalustris]
MMEENKENFLEETYGLFTNYVDDRILLLKIQTAEKSGKLMSAFVTIAVVALFTFFILLFVSIMGGYYFAELTGSTFKGFSIVAGIYCLLLLMFLVVNKQILSKRIIDLVIRIFFERSAVETDLSKDDE